MKLKLQNVISLDLDLYLPNRVLPKTEREVVELFSRLARGHFGFSSHTIQTRFPDCIARRGKEEN